MTVFDKRGGKLNVYYTPVLDLKIPLRFVSDGSAIDITGQTISISVYAEEDGALYQQSYPGTITDASDGAVTVTVPKSWFTQLEDKGFGGTVGYMISRTNGSDSVEQVGGVIEVTDTDQGGGYTGGNLVNVDVNDLTVEVTANDGLPGAAATVSVGTVTGLDAGETPTVENSGTPAAAVLDFGLPAGADGAGVQAGGTTGQILRKASNTDYDTEWFTSTALGDVVGPAGATDENIPLFDGATGKLLKNSSVSVASFATAAQGAKVDYLTVTANTDLDAIRSKVSGIETGADVTDAANVTAASAVMDDDFVANGFMQRTGVGTYTSGEIAISDLPEATSSEYRNNTADKLLSTDQVWSAADEVTLTDAPTITVDMATFINADVTLAGNRTLGNPSNAKPGQTGRIRVIQDGTGSRTLSFGSNYKFGSSGAPTLTTDADAEDILYYDVISATHIEIYEQLDRNN